MDLVDHPRSLNVVGFINPGPGADRVGKLFFIAQPELKNGDTHEARFGEIDLVQAIAEVVAAEGHDLAGSREVRLQRLLEAGELRCVRGPWAASCPAGSPGGTGARASKHVPAGE